MSFALTLAVLAALPGQWDLSRHPFRVLFQAPIQDLSFMDYLPEETASPVTDGRYVYAGSRGKVLICLDASSGQERWRHETHAAFAASPTLDGASVIAGDMDGRVLALDRLTGAVQWEARVGEAVMAAPVVSDGVVLVVDGRGGVLGLDRASGARRWRIQRETPRRFTIRSSAPVVLYEGSGLKGFPDGTLLRFDVQSGQEIKAFDLSGGQAELVDIDSPPLVLGDRAVAASFSGGLYGLDLKAGVVLWRVEGQGYALPTSFQGRALVVKDGQELLQVGLADGTLTPRYHARGRPIRALRSVGGDLYMADGKSLTRLNLGAPHASLRLPFLFGISSAPTGLGSRLFFITDSGYIYGIELL